MYSIRHVHIITMLLAFVIETLKHVFYFTSIGKIGFIHINESRARQLCEQLFVDSERSHSKR